MRIVSIFMTVTLVFVFASCEPEPPQDPSGGGTTAEPTNEFSDSVGQQFVRIEPGTFVMGSSGDPLPDALTDGRSHRARGDFDEFPAHEVAISEPFYLSVTEVTNAQFEQFKPEHRELRGAMGFSNEDNEAVVFVTWQEAQDFCMWLSEKEGKPYRLPTEAEWEYACRAGTDTLFSTGEELPEAFLKNARKDVWYPDPDRVEEGRTLEDDIVPLTVGETPANPWGLFDMHGNVEEWCYDWYGPYEESSQTDPVGRADGDFRVTRGGSHSTEPYYLRSANRMGTLPEDKHWLIGFRVAMADMPDTEPLPLPPVELCQENVSQNIPADVTQGPDPTTSYFEGPRVYVKIPPDSEGPMFSHHNHDPGIVECPNGDLLAVWYTTVSERGRELALVASRLRYGAKEWEPASPFWDAPDRNDHAPAIWYDGSGTIYQFVGLSAAATWGNLAIILRTSTDSGATWSKARIIASEHTIRHQPVESVFSTDAGAIALPCDASSRGSGGTALHISHDSGNTWADAGGTIAGIHAGVMQLKDGRLMAFGRGDDIDNHMPKSLSSDLGASWSYSASEFQPVGGGRRLVLTRLKEGPILLCSFASEPMDIIDGAGHVSPCSGLFAAVSFDEGETWPVKRLVTPGGEPRELAAMDGRPFTLSDTSAEPRGYMSICQGLDGVIHLISSMQHYAFNLAWLTEFANEGD